MKNFWFAHFCTWILNLPVISLPLFAGLAANIKCSLLLQLKNQQPIPRSNPDIKCWVISCLGDRSSPKCSLSHQINDIFFLSVSGYQELIHWLSWGGFLPCREPCTGCKLPDSYSHTHRVNANTSGSIYETDSVLFIPIYQTYPILFSSTNSINSSLHTLCK